MRWGLGMPFFAQAAVALLLGVSLGLFHPVPIALAASVGVAAALAALVRPAFARPIVLFAFFAAGVATVRAAERAVHRPESLHQGRVLTSPRSQPWGWTVDVASSGTRVRVGLDDARGIGPGDEVAFRSEVRAAEGFANPDAEPRFLRERREGVLSVARARDGIVRLAEGRGPSAAIERARRRVRRAIETDFAEPALSVVRALVLGETSSLPDETRRAFRETGTSHLLAVSGLHVVLFSVVAYGGLRRILVRTPLARRVDVSRIAAVAALPGIAAYTVFAGAGASAVRAGVMAGAVLAGRAIDRPRAPAAALAVAALGQAIADPACVLDPGWQLSYAAVVALGTLAPAFERLLGRRDGAIEPRRMDVAARIGRGVRAAVATNFATCLATAPLVAHHFGLATPASLVANLAGVPLTSAILLPGSLAYAAGVLLGLRSLAAWAAPALSGIVRVLVSGLAAIASVPGASAEVPAPGLLAAAVLTLALLLFPVLSARGRAVAVLAALLSLAPTVAAQAAPALRRDARVTFLDVGQGDAALVELPRSHAVLVDAGGLPGSLVDVGAREVAPYLARRAVRSLDLVVLSHPHPDHFGGLPAILARHETRAFWDSGQGEAESLDAALASILEAVRRAGGRVETPRSLCGRPRMIAGARFETLGPCPAHDSGFGPNDNSLVVRLTFGDVRFLFAGDVEAAGESWLEAHGGFDADVVKVPHHGSRTSSGPGLVAGSGAGVAVVSVGRRNRFGHPAPEVIDRWQASGTTVFRTDRDGAVVVETDGRTARIAPVRATRGFAGR